MTRIIPALVLAAMIVGCSITIGNPSFDVTGHGTGESLAKATEDARRDAERQVREMGYSEFSLSPNGTTMSSSSGNFSKVERGFTVKNAKKGRVSHHTDGDFCPVCQHERKCQCSAGDSH